MMLTWIYILVLTGTYLLLLKGCHAECPEMKGEKGDKGPTGPPGLDRLPGLKGSGGDPGHVGMPGRPGQVGLKGLTGEPGPYGDKGDRAPRPIIEPWGQAPQGPKGYPGPGPGPKGHPGTAGPPGVPGPPGLDGHPGGPGPDGTQGTCDDCEEPCYPGNTRVAFSGTSPGVTQSSEATVVSLNLHTNVGNGYQETSSQFTTPVPGVYTFVITAIANGNGAVPIGLYHNDNKVATTARSSSTVIGPYPLGANQVNVVMGWGDHVTLKAEAREGGIMGWVFSRNLSPTDVSFAGYWISPSPISY